jgi:hypothetical protein
MPGFYYTASGADLQGLLQKTAGLSLAGKRQDYGDERGRGR